MNSKFLLVIASLLCMIAGSSLAEDSDRGQLTRDQLLSSANSPDSPVANLYFLPINGTAPHHQFSGAITIPLSERNAKTGTRREFLSKTDVSLCAI